MPALHFLDLETVIDPAIGWTPKDDKDFPPPFACKVVCAGILTARGSDLHSVAPCGDDERAILERVFTTIATNEDQAVTWCGRTFDVPVLVARGIAHGLAWPWLYAVKGANYRYDTGGHWDVADDISLFGAGRTPKLDHGAKAIGLPGKIGGEGGSSVAQMWAEGRLDDIARYCLEDVCQLAIVSAHVKAFKGQSDMARANAFRERVLALPCASRLVPIQEAAQ